MLARFHQQQDTSELQEVQVLLRFERVLEKEWDDVCEQVLFTSHSERHSVSMIAANNATSEEVLQRVQELHIAFVLHDDEFRQNLKTCAHLGMLIDPDKEAAF